MITLREEIELTLLQIYNIAYNDVSLSKAAILKRPQRNFKEYTEQIEQAVLDAVERAKPNANEYNDLETTETMNYKSGANHAVNDYRNNLIKEITGK